MAETEVAIKDVLGAVQKVAATRDPEGLVTPHHRDPEAIAALAALLAAQPVDPASDAGQQAIADAVAALTAAQPDDPATNASLVSLLNATAVRDNLGGIINPEAMQQTLGYTAGVLTSVTATDGTSTWVQTLTYADGNLTGVSKWVKQ